MLGRTASLLAGRQCSFAKKTPGPGRFLKFGYEPVPAFPFNWSARRTSMDNGQTDRKIYGFAQKSYELVQNENTFK